MGIGADSLANTQVGGTSCGCPNLTSAYRFIAGQSAALSSIDIYLVDGSGYAGGNGGTMKIAVQADNGGVPSGVDLASTTIQPGNPISIGYLPLVSFPSPASLTAGQVYEIVFSNVDPNPTVNYVSVNSLFTFGSAVITPRYPNGEWTQLMNDGSGWAVRQNFVPILGLNYANGQSEGMGYMEVWVNAPKAISGSAEVREQFTPQVDVPVASISVRLRRSSGSSPLTVTLETATGSALGSGTVPAADIPTASPVWVSVPISATLTAGQGYHIVLSAPSDTAYSAFGIERGNAYRFAPSTYFADGFGQWTTDGSTWSGFDQPGGSKNNPNADMQFYVTEP